VWDIQRACKNKEICYACVTTMVILLRYLCLKIRRRQGDLGLSMKKTVLVKVKVKFILGRTMKAWRGISVTAVHFLFNFGAR